MAFKEFLRINRKKVGDFLLILFVGLSVFFILLIRANPQPIEWLFVKRGEEVEVVAEGGKTPMGANESNSSGPQWRSPSGWLYVYGEGNTVYTAYGNFTFYGDARVRLEKNGAEYDTVDWYFIADGKKADYDVSYEYECNETERWCNVTQILSFADGSQFNISHHFNIFRDKLSFDIYSAHERNVTILMHHHIKGFQKYYNGTEWKDIEMSELKDIKKLNVSELKSDVKRMGFNWGNSIQHVDSVKFNSTDLLFRTKDIHFSAGQRVHIDPTWVTPSGVESSCGEDTNYEATQTIDGDTSTDWRHSSKEEHNIIYDTGSSQTITQIKLNIPDPDAIPFCAPCKLTAIYVCDDNACSGESSLGTCGTWTGSAGNRTCDITDTTGQWIKIKINTFYASCGENKLGWIGNRYGLFEFWYEAAAADSTPPEVSIQSPTNTTYTSNPIEFNVTLNEDGSWCGYSLNGSANVTMVNQTGDWEASETLGDSAYHCVFCCNDTTGNMNCTEDEYFSVSTTKDATFNISMPSEYDWDEITGTTEGGATAVALISFNFTDLGENFTEPYAEGDSSKAQAGTAKPIFYIDPTGNTDINISLKLASSLPNGISIMANASCAGTYDSCQATLQNLTTSYVTLVDDLSQTDSFANITLFANVSQGTSPTGSGLTLYIKGED